MANITVLTVPEKYLPAVRSCVQAWMKYFNATHSFHHGSGYPPGDLLNTRDKDAWLIITPLSRESITSLAGHDRFKFEAFQEHRDKHQEFLTNISLGAIQLDSNTWKSALCEQSVLGTDRKD